MKQSITYSNSLSPSIRLIPVKLRTFLRMPYNRCKFCSNPSIRTIYLETKERFRLSLAIDWKDVTETLCIALYAHALQTVDVWLKSVNKEGQFIWRTKYFFFCILPSHGGM